MKISKKIIDNPEYSAILYLIFKNKNGISTREIANEINNIKKQNTTIQNFSNKITRLKVKNIISLKNDTKNVKKMKYVIDQKWFFNFIYKELKLENVEYHDSSKNDFQEFIFETFFNFFELYFIKSFKEDEYYLSEHTFRQIVNYFFIFFGFNYYDEIIWAHTINEELRNDPKVKFINENSNKSLKIIEKINKICSNCSDEKTNISNILQKLNKEERMFYEKYESFSDYHENLIYRELLKKNFKIPINKEIKPIWDNFRKICYSQIFLSQLNFKKPFGLGSRFYYELIYLSDNRDNKLFFKSQLINLIHKIK
jgi:hypothetical protein